MYWAKKVLEWTPDAATALEIGLYLNDRFAMDGNDPNGFVGVGWSARYGVEGEGGVWKDTVQTTLDAKGNSKVADFVAKYPPAAKNASRFGISLPEPTKKGAAATKKEPAKASSNVKNAKPSTKSRLRKKLK